jgi:hypothetical protein
VYEKWQGYLRSAVGAALSCWASVVFGASFFLKTLANRERAEVRDEMLDRQTVMI